MTISSLKRRRQKKKNRQRNKNKPQKTMTPTTKKKTTNEINTVDVVRPNNTHGFAKINNIVKNINHFASMLNE